MTRMGFGRFIKKDKKRLASVGKATGPDVHAKGVGGDNILYDRKLLLF